MREVLLEYTKEYSEISNTPTGLSVMTNLERAYKDKNIRNRCIVRIDCIRALNSIFSQESVDKYRKMIWLLMSGQFDMEKMSVALRGLYEKDLVFNRWLSELYEFDPEVTERPFYLVIYRNLLISYKEVVDNLKKCTQSNRYKFIGESEGYVLISIQDDLNPMNVPRGCEVEVYSRAKVWDGAYNEYM